MPPPGYKSVNLPVEIIEKVDRRVAKDSRFRTRDELVRHAVLDYLTVRPVS